MQHVPNTLSAAELELCMRGVQFPAARRQLIDRAREQGASAQARAFFERLADRDYASATEVLALFGSQQASKRAQL